MPCMQLVSLTLQQAILSLLVLLDLQEVSRVLEILAHLQPADRSNAVTSTMGKNP